MWQLHQVTPSLVLLIACQGKHIQQMWQTRPLETLMLWRKTSTKVERKEGEDHQRESIKLALIRTSTWMKLILQGWTPPEGMTS